jgi:hypothetical protein
VSVEDCMDQNFSVFPSLAWRPLGPIQPKHKV